MIAYLSLQGFYVRALGMDLQPDPVLVIKNKRVLDLNVAALQRRVNPEMTAKDAKACLMGGKFVPWKELDFTDAQQEWLSKCADFSDVIEPDEQHSAWIDLSRHPDPFRTFLALRDAFGPVRCGSARVKWLAKVAALRGDQNHLAWYKPHDFLSRIPLRDLVDLETEVIERLEFLGYPLIGLAAQIPLDVLMKQFGKRAIEIQSILWGEHSEQVRPLYPSQAVGDRYYFSDPIEPGTALESTMLKLATRLGNELQARDLYGHELQLVIEAEEGELLLQRRIFTKPLHDRRSIYFAAHRLLSAMSISKPIASVRIRIQPLEKRVRFQKVLEVDKPLPNVAQVERALKHVRQTFGNECVRIGSEIEVPRRLLVLKEWRNATGWQ